MLKVFSKYTCTITKNFNKISLYRTTITSFYMAQSAGYKTVKLCVFCCQPNRSHLMEIR